MQLSSISLAITRQYGPLKAFNPATLFANGEQGVWYDQSDVNVNWRRNLLTYSEQFDNAVWLRTANTISPNSTVAPDGTMTADKLVETTATNTHEVRQDVATAAAPYVFSAYVKAAGRNFAMLYHGQTGAVQVVNLTTGALSGNAGLGAPTSATTSNEGNGWFRVSITITTTAASNNFRVYPLLDAITYNYTGDGTSGIYIWGAQLEQVSTATEYQRITDGIQDYLTYQPLPVLYQDAAGTTPVTAVEQPVGLMLDKSKGLVLGHELVTDTGLNNPSAWTTGGVSPTWTVSGGKAIVTQTASGNRWLINGTQLTVGKTYVVTADVVVTAGSVGPDMSATTAGDAATSGSKKWIIIASTPTLQFIARSAFIGDLDNISVRELPGNHAYQPTSASRPVLSSRYNLLLATESLSTQTVTTAATTYTLKFSGAGTITLAGTAIGVYTAGTYSISCTAGTLSVTVVGLATQADLRPANDGVNLPPYQRVNTATDYDSVGFPLYLKTDGVDDFMLTNSIDFTGTDKMTVWVGVRKLSDATLGIVTELSASSTSNTGTFAVFAPRSSADYGFRSFGTGLSDAISGSSFPAPITNVLTGIGNISGDQAILRVNGTQVASSAADQSTGNYGNFPIYLFRRGGTSLPAAVRFFGAVIRGAQSTAAQIAATEAYLNSKTKAF